jgi:PilZ domain
VQSVKPNPGSLAQGGDTFLMNPVRKQITKKTRQSPRIEVFVPVLVCTPKEEIKGKMTDLSFTGAFIIVPKLPDLTSSVQLFIDIPNSHAILDAFVKTPKTALFEYVTH